MALRDDLVALQTLLATGWTATGAVAVDGSTRPVDPRAGSATAWSVVGACVKLAAGDLARQDALTGAIRDQHTDGVLAYDMAAGRRLADVTSLITRAVEAKPTAVDPKPAGGRS